MRTITKLRSEHASFDEAAVAILAILDDGDWHKSTAEIHEPLRPWVQEHMFGKVKSHYRIEHRRVGGGPDSYYEWRRVTDAMLPPSGAKTRPDSRARSI